MPVLNWNDWSSVDLDTLLLDVLQAVECGEIDQAFEKGDFLPGTLSRSKIARNHSKNYLKACLQAGVQGISEANADTALGLINAYRRMNTEAPLTRIPEGYRVYAVKIPQERGAPDIEIYIKEGHRVLYGP